MYIHHLLAEELGDALDVRGFAAAGAGTGIIGAFLLSRNHPQP